MIDEEKLKKWELATKIEGSSYPERMKDMQEILRLARLGLWAEKYAMTALKDIRKYSLGSKADTCDEALAALPKEKE